MRAEWLKSPDQALLLTEDTPEPLLLRIASGVAAVYSAVSPDKDTDNEDAAGLIPIDNQSAVLCVADGVGGSRGGENASATAIQTLKRVLEQPRDADIPLRAAVLNGIESANESVIALANGSQTTLALVGIHQSHVRPFHVGDSVVLVVGQRGAIKLQTISHSPVGFAVESGMLDEGDAMHHEDRYLVSNVVGAPDMRIELGAEIELSSYDTVLIASDGLLDNLHIEEIIEYIRKGSLEVAARGLSETASRRMREPEEGAPSKPDDLTFVLYRQNPPKRGKKTN